MPDLIKLYIRQCAIGFALAAVFVGLLFAFNVGNLWHLVTHSDAGLIAAAMLWVANGIVFAGVQFGISVMRMGQRDDDPRPPRRPRTAPMAIPVRAEPPRSR
jgi:predicted branched-subunit amino acid permease